MTYELWDLDTGNMLGDFQIESAAMAAVRRVSAVSGGTDQLALEKRDRLGRSTVLTGRELLEWAQGWAARQGRPRIAVRFAYESNTAVSKGRVWAKEGGRTLSKSSTSAHHVLRDSKGRFVSHGKRARKK